MVSCRWSEGGGGQGEDVLRTGGDGGPPWLSRSLMTAELWSEWGAGGGRPWSAFFGASRSPCAVSAGGAVPAMRVLGFVGKETAWESAVGADAALFSSRRAQLPARRARPCRGRVGRGSPPALGKTPLPSSPSPLCPLSSRFSFLFSIFYLAPAPPPSAPPRYGGCSPRLECVTTRLPRGWRRGGAIWGTLKRSRGPSASAALLALGSVVGR